MPQQPPVYADYTDYGEEVLWDDALNNPLDDMIKLERVPNRRDSVGVLPSSPVEKLQQEENHAMNAIPAMWAAEHNLTHHGEY